MCSEFIQFASLDPSAFPLKSVFDSQTMECAGDIRTRNQEAQGLVQVLLPHPGIWVYAIDWAALFPQNS